MWNTPPIRGSLSKASNRWGSVHEATRGDRTGQRARVNIDAGLRDAGWAVQHRGEVNLSAARGVAMREFPLDTGPAGYLLFLDGKAAGVVEAKPDGQTLTGVEVQAEKYGVGLPTNLTAPVRRLAFQYLSTGSRTKLTAWTPSRGALGADRNVPRPCLGVPLEVPSRLLEDVPCGRVP